MPLNAGVPEYSVWPPRPGPASSRTRTCVPACEPRDGRAVCPECGRADDAIALSGDRPVNWPAFRDAWLAVAHGVAQSGMPTVLLGPFIPGHLQELPARRWIADIHFLVLDCPDEVRRARISARPPWRSRDTEEQVEFGRWLRRNIADRIDTGSGTPEDTAAAITIWIDRHLAGTETSTPAK